MRSVTRVLIVDDHAALRATLSDYFESSGFVVDATGVEGGRNGTFLLSTGGASAVPWGNGSSFRCLTPPLARTPVQTASGSLGLCNGSLQVDLNTWMTQNPTRAPQPGDVARVQAWFRDPLSTSSQPTSLSDALRYGVCP